MKKAVKKGEKILDMVKDKEIICAKLDGKIVSLDYMFKDEGEHDIEFLSLSDSNATRIYESSIRFLVGMAIKLVNPRLDVRFFYNISRSIFCRIISKNNFKINANFVKKVSDKMKELVDADLKIERMKISKEEALKLYHQQGFIDKVNVLKYRPENFSHLFYCKYKNFTYYDYLYSPLVVSTSYLNKFILRIYQHGFLIQVPRSENKGEIPTFIDEIKFATTLAHTSKWAELNHLDTISNINQFVKKYGAMSLINLSEARFNNTLAVLGEKIMAKDNTIKMVCIAGPSSSGKTSFANRLTFELMTYGLRPIRISMDDFYIPKAELPKGTDIESAEAIDIPFFNELMSDLIQGEKVRLPSYNFKDGLRKFGRETRLGENSIIIIEGIHALNSKLTASIPEHQKFKVYIAPQPQVNIDNHTPLSMTDLRLLRRITRDARTRGSDAKETISMWPNVRNGEFKYIYPSEENADFIFDTFLHYEPCALSKIVLPLLDKINPDCEEYTVAMRLKNTVKYFLPISLDDIPCNSLMREFVGGSSFKDAR